MPENEGPFGLDMDYVNVDEFPGLEVGDVVKIIPDSFNEEIEAGEFVLITVDQAAEDQLIFRVADELAAISTSYGEVGTRISHVDDEGVYLEVLSALEDGGRQWPLK